MVERAARLSQVGPTQPAQRPVVGVEQQHRGPVGLLEATSQGLAVLVDTAGQRLTRLDLTDTGELEALQGRTGAHEVGHEVVGGVGQDLLGCRELGDPGALLEDRDAIAHLDRLVDVVGDEGDRLLQFVLEAEELVLQTGACDRVDGPEGFVHQQHRRVGRQRPRHTDALALSAGELLGEPFAVLVGREPDHLEQFVHALLGAILVPSEQLGHGRHVVPDPDVREQPDLLDHVADPPPQVVRIDGGDVFTVDDDVARRRFDDAVDHLEAGRLAAARRSDEDDDLTLGDLQAQAIHRGRLLPGEPLGELLELDHRLVEVRLVAEAGLGMVGVCHVTHGYLEGWSDGRWRGRAGRTAPPERR